MGRKVDVTRVARPLPCPRCGGSVVSDSLDLAPLACILCAERYSTSLAPLRRPPSTLEMSRKYRYSVSRSEGR